MRAVTRRRRRRGDQRSRASLDDLAPGVQQDGVGVGLGSEHAVAVVEVVGERLRDLEAAATVPLIPLLPLLLGCRLVGLPVRLRGRACLPRGAGGLLLSWAQAVVRLGLHGDQGGGQARVLSKRTIISDGLFPQK